MQDGIRGYGQDVVRQIGWICDRCSTDHFTDHSPPYCIELWNAVSMKSRGYVPLDGCMRNQTPSLSAKFPHKHLKTPFSTIATGDASRKTTFSKTALTILRRSIPPAATGRRVS
jgi:hypothetical protein